MNKTQPHPGGPARAATKSAAFLRGTIIAGAAALSVELLMLAAVPAAAAKSPEEFRVAHRDLDLTSDADLALLDLRVTAAARAACRAPDRLSDPIISYRRCVADTVAIARKQVVEVISRRRASGAAASRSPRGAA